MADRSQRSAGRITDAVRAGATLVTAAAVAVIAASVFLVAREVVRGDIPGTRGEPTISVSGVGEVERRPDTATFEMTFSGEGKTAGIAIEHANQLARRATRGAMGAGIPERDIATSGIATHRNSYDRRRPWRATTTISVKARDLREADDALVAIKDIPMESFEGPRFSFANKNELAELAVAEAVASARKKADDAARRGGMRVVRTRSIEEADITVDEPSEQYHEASEQSLEAGMTSGHIDSMTVSASVVDVARRSGTFTATVLINAVFELEQA